MASASASSSPLAMFSSSARRDAYSCAENNYYDDPLDSSA